jgi:hypothetical protein
MADLTVKTYDPKQVVITFGVIPISGYADGTFVSVNRSGDAFTKKKGAAGDVERVNKNQGDFEVTVTLLQTAAVNAELSAALAADQLTTPAFSRSLSRTCWQYVVLCSAGLDPQGPGMGRWRRYEQPCMGL